METFCSSGDYLFIELMICIVRLGVKLVFHCCFNDIFIYFNVLVLPIAKCCIASDTSEMLSIIGPSFNISIQTMYESNLYIITCWSQSSPFRHNKF